MKKYMLLVILLVVLTSITSAQGITRIWLSFKTNTPTHLVINWQSPESGNSEVILKIGDKEVFSATKNEDVFIHHIEVPLPQTDVEYTYRVGTNNQKSKWNTFQGMPAKKPLKVAVFANWGFGGDANISNVLKEKPEFIITGGDNVPSLFEYGKEGNKNCIESYLKLIDAHPELFNHFPFMPTLGNHDKQLHPRGPKPPENFMVYDTLSTAFTTFFELPDDEWKWSFEIPDYNIQFFGVDLNHIGDIGKTWQTYRRYDANSVQYKWYKYG
ncbi:MAG: metallophosphoesterase family protein, partial [Draconibacterium sp.]|nr:metallophosphoesterase family protein [Draconibacterium sp.]